ncbi:ASCH domain-containing protein [Bacteroides sp. 1001136B_160425_E2]|uniref:ASCH domain-containing protein n=1 Tax=Bacteroides sp. 1001136B_160425_E2 TaxID=2787083 RepID=UPI00189CFF72|nr:ASCH domain-containing protein [Bacteroides sp. 1001136B_160425_E2]
MKAITIKQPWASLIVHGIKDIENRSWRTNFRGRVLIHASGSHGRKFSVDLTDAQTKAAFAAIAKETMFGNMPFGSIIGSVEIVDCVLNHPSIWADKGIYNWVLANPILFEKPFENVKGKLSFWDYSGCNEVKIECPECGSIEMAVEDYTTVPFNTFIHSCNKCGYVIMESEWNKINE